MEKMKKAARQRKTSTLKDAVMMIGGGNVSTELRMSRAVMLDVICEREGEEACDAILNVLGM